MSGRNLYQTLSEIGANISYMWTCTFLWLLQDLLLLYRFTELYIDEPRSATDLSVLIHDYLRNESPSTALVEGVVRYIHMYTCSLAVSGLINISYAMQGSGELSLVCNVIFYCVDFICLWRSLLKLNCWMEREKYLITGTQFLWFYLFHITYVHAKFCAEAQYNFYVIHPQPS